MKNQQEEIERLKSEQITLAEEIADIRGNVEFSLKSGLKNRTPHVCIFKF